MSIFINNVVIAGVLGSKEKLWEGEKEGARKIGFTIITKRDFKKADGGIESKETSIPCSTFGDSATTVDKMSEGEPISIRGEFENRQYESNGETRSWKGVAAFQVSAG